MAVEVVDVGMRLQPVEPQDAAGSMRGPATTTIPEARARTHRLQEGVDDAPE